MEKVLISLSVPALPDQYEVFVPDDMPLGELVPLLVEGVASISAGRYQSSGEEMLCDAQKGLLNRLQLTLRQCGLGNGDELYLL